MLVELSLAVVLIVSAAVCLLSLWGIYAPRALITLVNDVFEHRAGMIIAVVVRLLLGASLICISPVSRFPAVFAILGWIAVVAAVALMISGRRIVRALLAWIGRSPTALVRLWLVFGFAFGAFLIYGAV
jgi:hypothetical protein